MTEPVRPSWVPDDLFPYADRYLELDGHLVHYVDEGTGPPMLFLHGQPTWSFVYRHLIARLRDRFRCLALDYPGFGLSRAAAGYDFRPRSHSQVVERFVDALGLNDLTLMVHDWGGPIGLGFAGRRPETMRALILGNTWAWPAERRSMRLFAALLGGPLSPLLVNRLNLFVNVFLPGGIRSRKLSDREMDAYRMPWNVNSRRPMQVFPGEIVRSRRFLAEVERNLARLRHLPTLIAWPDRDVAFTTVERERFEQLFPRHRTVVLQGAGHYLQEDAPNEIADAIERWWIEEVAADSGLRATAGTT